MVYTFGPFSVRRYCSFIGYCILLLFSIGGLAMSTLVHAQAPSGSSGTTFQEAGRLPITYIDRATHGLSHSNWAVTQDTSGFVYVGNDDGILVHDGVRWSSLELGMIIRSLVTDAHGQVYVGGSGDLGQLKVDAHGVLQFHSLLEAIPDSARDFTDVWYMQAYDDGVAFLTVSYLFQWDGTQMEVIPLEDGDSYIRNIDVLNGQLYGLTEKGLHVVPPKAVQTQEPTYVLHRRGTEDTIQDILPIEDNVFIAYYAESILWRCEGPPSAPSCTRFPTAIDDQLREGYYSATYIGAGITAFGFDGKGIALIDREGQLLRWIDEDDGLLNTEVMSLYTDREGLLWAALYDGLAILDVTTPLTTFGKSEGLPSAVSDIVRYNNTLYASTMLGVYRLNTAAQPARFEPVPGSEGDINCYDFIERPNALIVGCTRGALRITDDGMALIPVSNRDAFTFFENIFPSTHDEQTFYLADDMWLGVYRYEDGQLQHQHTVADIRRANFLVEEPATGVEPTLWVYSWLDGLMHLTWAADGTLQRTFAFPYSSTGEVKDMMWWEDHLHLVTASGLYRVEATANGYELIQSSALADLALPTETPLNVLVDDPYGRRWVLTETRTAVWDSQADGTWLEHPSNALQALEGKETMAVYAEEDVAWIAQNNEIVRYHLGGNSTVSPPQPIRAYVRRVHTLSTDSLVYGGHLSQEAAVHAIPYAANSLRLTYAAPTHRAAGPVHYRVQLKGLDPDWGLWTEETQKDYTTLPPGEYTFRVQARQGQARVSTVATFSFSIAPPWYLTWWARVIWFGVTVGGIALIARTYNTYRTKRLETVRRELERQVAERTAALHDRTLRLEQLNEALELRSVELRETLAQNKQILGITAHDLKNPLGGIQALAEMLVDDYHDFPDEERIEQVELIRDEAGRTLTIIRDLLDRYKESAPAAEVVNLDRKPTALEPLLRNVVRWNKRQALAKRMTLHLSASIKPSVLVDVSAMQRAVDNLVSNAIKYSPPGSTIRITLAEASNGELQIQVIDQGPGLTEADKARAFGKLQRLSAQPTGGEHSTGLGLFIVKQLVEAHGGRVGVESTHGEGATFWLRLPESAIVSRALV
ncbi:MAG: hypothetical protein RhofKO_23760 [Rhodothermales bacterium]